MNHLIDILQLSTQEIDELVEKAKDIIANPEAYAHKCDGKILATLFFEPSTRTRLSFESAMLSLGASRLLWEDAALVPRDIVLYGNLPSKQFYSDATMPAARVRELAGELLQRMRATGHPFILGSECDVLNVPGSEVRIREKVKAFLEV